MLKVTIMGYDGPPFPSVLERFKKELISQGCQIIDNNPELLIEICGIYDKAQNFYRKCPNKPVRLFNLLDVNNSSPTFYNQARLDYEKCEIACTISNTIKKQIKEKFQTNREIHVIGFPMRPITFKKYLKGLHALYVGRWKDLNKRTYLIQPTLRLLGQNPINDLAVIGPEKPPYECFYQGIVKDEQLDDLYNAAEFTYLPSRLEGLGLSCVESLIAGSVPLLCRDNLVIGELDLKEFSTFPNPESLANLVKKVKKNVEWYWNKMDELRPIFQKQFSIETVTKNMLDLYWAYKRGELR